MSLRMSHGCCCWCVLLFPGTRDYDRVDADPIQAPSSSERRRRRTLPAQPVAAPGRDAVRRYSTQTPQGVGAGAGAGAGGDSAMNPRHAQLGRISTIAEGDHGSDGGRPGGAASDSDMAAALARYGSASCCVQASVALRSHIAAQAPPTARSHGVWSVQRPPRPDAYQRGRRWHAQKRRQRWQ